MKKIKIFALAALFFASVPASADYNSCRCNLSAPGIDISICCKNNYGGYGADGDSRCCSAADISAGKTWSSASKTCVDACSSYKTCTSGTGGWVKSYQFAPSDCNACCGAGKTGTLGSTNVPCGGNSYQTCTCQNSTGTGMTWHPQDPVTSAQMPGNGSASDGFTYVGNNLWAPRNPCEATDGYVPLATYPKCPANASGQACSGSGVFCLNYCNFSTYPATQEQLATIPTPEGGWGGNPPYQYITTYQIMVCLP